MILRGLCSVVSVNLDWHSHIASCGTSGTVLNYSNVATVIIFGIIGICCLIIIIRRILISENAGINIRESSFLVFLSAFSLFYTIIWGTVMLISLFFKFDLQCLKSKKNKKDFELLWLLVLESVVAGVILLISSIYISLKIDRTQKIQKELP